MTKSIEEAQISIIMPVYNTGIILHDTFASILNQTFRNFELIIVDDGSTDNSGIICDSYSKQDNRIKTFHKQNGGISEARNFGLSKVTAKYVAFCDHDDIFEQTLLEKAIEVIEQFQCDIVKFGAKIINEPKKSIYIKQYSYNNNAQLYKGSEINSNILEMLNKGILNNIWTSVYKYEIISTNRLLFNTKLKHGGEDFDFNINFFKNIHSIVLIPDILYKHYYRNSLSTSAKLYDDVLNNFLDKIENIYDLSISLKIFDVRDSYNYFHEYVTHITSYILYAIKMSKQYLEIKLVLKTFNKKERLKPSKISFRQKKTFTKGVRALLLYVIFSLFNRKRYYLLYFFLKSYNKLSNLIKLL